LNELSYPFIVDDHDLLAGGNIVAGGKVGKYLLGLKLISNDRDRGYTYKSTTHITCIMMEQEFVKREPLREPYRFNLGGKSRL